MMKAMTFDRYTKAVLTVIAAALTAIALNPWLQTISLRSAEAQIGPPRFEAALPKAWGKVINFGGGDVMLEDKDGVLRQIEVAGKPPEYPKLKLVVTRN